ncbi:MAG: AzlC family ABC transporter permease [Deltaproteobacteria bacterium]
MSDAAESPRAIALRGARDMLPVMLGGIPFGLIAGVSASGLELSPLEATAISASVFAGASQLAAYELLANDAPLIVVFITAVIINLRFMIYSAAIAPTFRGEPLPKRIVYAYLLTDQAYALTAARERSLPHRVAYYFGCAVPMWTMWVSTTAVGAFAGASIPPSWSLEFAVPLCFIALLAPAIRDRKQVACAVVTAVAAVLLLKAPHHSGVILSVLIGIGFGLALDRVRA